MYHGQNTTNISDQYELCLNMSKYVDCCICIVQIRFFFVKTSCHNQGCQLMHSWGNGDRCKQAITVWHFTMDQKAILCSKIQIIKMQFHQQSTSQKQQQSFYNVKYGSSIIMSKSLSDNLSNENKHSVFPVHFGISIHIVS